MGLIYSKEELMNRLSELRDKRDLVQRNRVAILKKYTRKGDGIFAVRMKGTPVHVKSALNYNDYLAHLVYFALYIVARSAEILASDQ